MKLDVALVVGGMKINPARFELEPLGGSETAGWCMARELARCGHRVFLFCASDQYGTYDDVHLLPLDQSAAFLATVPHDVTIIQRMPTAFARPMASKLNVLWLHDLAQTRSSRDMLGCAWNMDIVFAVSEWHRRQIIDATGIPEDLVVATRNGIPLSLIEAAPPAARSSRKRIVYGARPERGLDVLLGAIAPRILEVRQDVEFVCAAYDIDAPHFAQFYQHIDALKSRLSDHVVTMGALGKRDLWALYKSSDLYLYPTPSPVMPNFAETSCISIMEALACGLPVLCSDRGALPETAGGAATLVHIPDGFAADAPEAVERFVEHALKLLDAPKSCGSTRAAELDWSSVAREWDQLLQGRIRANNSDPVALARHFYSRQSIEAAEWVLEHQVTDPIDVERAAPLAAEIKRRYAFRASDDAMADYYRAKVGPSYAPSYESMKQQPDRFQQPIVPRFATILSQIRQMLPAGVDDRPLRVLDYGSAHGELAILIANQLGAQVDAVDVDPAACDAGRMFAEMFCQRGAVNFWSTDIRGLPALIQPQKQYDVLLVCEVLEHLIDPIGVLTALEAWVRPGGVVIVTVPYGPWETQSEVETRVPRHVREYERADLDDMFGHRPDYTALSSAAGVCPITMQPLGWHLAAYRADDQPIRPIDMARKAAVQRPREGVSLTMIAGSQTDHQTLPWCLEAAAPYVDEIVIADCGMTDIARKMALAIGARIVPGADPKEHGFDTARNMALDAAREPWVLWIDTDEKLINGAGMAKYLRSNAFNAYAIAQHHFAIDATFEPDRPTRLFRRGPRASDGKSMRFIGRIHEHPEFGVNGGPGHVLIVPEVNIAHVGYLDEPTRRKRFSRNLPGLLRDAKDYPDRKLQKHLLCRDNMLMARYELENSRGLITPRVVELCQDTIRLWREHFRGEPRTIGQDTLEYYSEACRLLNLGFDAVVGWTISRDGVVEESKPRQARFATQEDFQIEMTARLKSATDFFSNRWW